MKFLISTFIFFIFANVSHLLADKFEIKNTYTNIYSKNVQGQLIWDLLAGFEVSSKDFTGNIKLNGHGFKSSLGGDSFQINDFCAEDDKGKPNVCFPIDKMKYNINNTKVEFEAYLENQTTEKLDQVYWFCGFLAENYTSIQRLVNATNRNSNIKETNLIPKLSIYFEDKREDYEKFGSLCQKIIKTRHPSLEPIEVAVSDKTSNEIQQELRFLREQSKLIQDTLSDTAKAIKELKELSKQNTEIQNLTSENNFLKDKIRTLSNEHSKISDERNKLLKQEIDSLLKQLNLAQDKSTETVLQLNSAKNELENALTENEKKNKIIAELEQKLALASANCLDWATKDFWIQSIEKQMACLPEGNGINKIKNDKNIVHFALKYGAKYQIIEKIFERNPTEKTLSKKNWSRPVLHAVRNGYPARVIQTIHLKSGNSNLVPFDQIMRMPEKQLKSWSKDIENNSFLKDVLIYELENQKFLSEYEELAISYLKLDAELMLTFSDEIKRLFDNWSKDPEIKNTFLGSAARHLIYQTINSTPQTVEKLDILKSLGLDLKVGYNFNGRKTYYLYEMALLDLNQRYKTDQTIDYSFIELFEYFYQNSVPYTTQIMFSIKNEKDWTENPLHYLAISDLEDDTKILVTNWFLERLDISLSQDTLLGRSLITLAQSKKSSSKYFQFLKALDEGNSKDTIIDELNDQISALQSDLDSLKSAYNQMVSEKMELEKQLRDKQNTKQSKTEQTNSDVQKSNATRKACVELPYAKLVFGTANTTRLNIELDGQYACFQDVPSSRTDVMNKTIVIFSDVIKCVQTKKSSRLDAADLVKTLYKVRGKYDGPQMSARGFRLLNCTFDKQ